MEGKGSSSYSQVFSNIFFLDHKIKIWVFHILMCFGRVWPQINGGNRLSRDWWGGENHYKNLNVICTKKAFISLVFHIVRWGRHLWHKTTPILHHNIHTKRNLGTNKITAELTPWIPPKTPLTVACYKRNVDVFNFYPVTRGKGANPYSHIINTDFLNIAIIC
jgi:hypothetical protein